MMRKGEGKTSKDAQILEDRIGELPEDVLGIVFSHLTIKEAGRTSILSHRWKNMWTLTPNFCFDGSERMKRTQDFLLKFRYGERKEIRKDLIEVEKMEYIKGVNQALDNYRGLDLENLIVVFYLDARDSLHLDNWITFALRKKVKTIKIDLHTCYYESDRASYSFLRSAHVTSGVECLTSLILKNVRITGEAAEDLLLVCPLLENLNLDSAKDLLNLRVAGSSLKLKYLSIMRCYHLRNLQIYAPKLVSFNYDSKRSRFVGGSTLQVEGLSSLVDLYIHNTSLTLRDFVQFFNYFSQLETLKLDFSYENHRQLRGLPQLTNLKNLTFNIMSFPLFHLGDLLDFINLCPLLRKFTLKLLDDTDTEVLTRPYMRWGNYLPHQYLKVVEMIGFDGRNTAIEVAKFFLRSVTSLEKLILNTSYILLAMDEKEVRLSTGNVASGLREIHEKLRRAARPGVELLIV